jgi:hypothetical protein
MALPPAEQAEVDQRLGFAEWVTDVVSSMPAWV